MSGNFFGGQFFGGGFFGAIVTTDTHDGGDEPRRRRQVSDEEIEKEIKQRAKEYKRHHEKLRKDIELALEGPQDTEVIEVLEENLVDEREAIREPGYEPELHELILNMRALRKIAELAIEEERRRFEEDEQEVELLLLH